MRFISAVLARFDFRLCCSIGGCLLLRSLGCSAVSFATLHPFAFHAPLFPGSSYSHPFRLPRQSVWLAGDLRVVVKLSREQFLPPRRQPGDRNGRCFWRFSNLRPK